MKASKFKSIFVKHNNKHDNNNISFSRYTDKLKDLVYSIELERLSFPTEIFIELTNKCNLECIYCYKKSTHSKNNHTLNINDIKRIAENIGYNPSSHVILEGGEPLLHPEFVEVFIELKKYNIPVEIITNGMYLEPEIIAQVSKVFDGNYDDFQISLDGIGELNRFNRGVSSERVLSGVRNLNDFGIKPRINCVVTNKNYKGIIELIQYLNDNCEINSLSFNTPIGRMFEDLILKDQIAEDIHNKIMDLKNRLKFDVFGSAINVVKDCSNYSQTDIVHMRCTAMRSKICISACGNVYPCVFMENKIKPLGNVRQHTLQEIWSSARSKIFVETLIANNRKCANCLNAKYCPQMCAGGQ